MATCAKSPCGRGFYKSSSQDLQCSRCPAHSYNDREGSWKCECEDGYYRAPSDSPSFACTRKNGNKFSSGSERKETALGKRNREGEKASLIGQDDSSISASGSADNMDLIRFSPRKRARVLETCLIDSFQHSLSSSSVASNGQGAG
ncbi:ephrin type-A receptor 7 isoform X1 [Tachysurus ichikawai]